ncbi:hypothetical protein ACVV2G_17300 [Streptomyces ziwulingensis]
MGGGFAEVRSWANELDAVHERFVHRFNREEPRQSALAYMRGLVAPPERKNGWTLAAERADAFHVMATTRHGTVVTRWAIDHPVHDLFPGLPRQKWRRRSCGEGALGRRIHDWARVEVRPWHREGRRLWVPARRSVSRPDEISYYIAYCPAGTTLEELARVAGSRWAVEECASAGGDHREPPGAGRAVLGGDRGPAVAVPASSPTRYGPSCCGPASTSPPRTYPRPAAARAIPCNFPGPWR